jgi:hypothetical protein
MPDSNQSKALTYLVLIQLPLSQSGEPLYTGIEFVSVLLMNERFTRLADPLMELYYSLS